MTAWSIHWCCNLEVLQSDSQLPKQVIGIDVGKHHMEGNGHIDVMHSRPLRSYFVTCIPFKGLEAVLDRHQFTDSRETTRLAAGGGGDDLLILP